MLSIESLENVRQTGNKLTARCPACHEIGADRTGQHLAYWPDTGKFACAANPGDKPHRQRIWQLVGAPDARTESFRPSRAEGACRQEEAAHARHREALAAAARRDASRIFSMDWPPEDIWHESPVILDSAEPDWRLLLGSLFPPEAVIWIGEPTDSGPGHELHFQRWPDWFDSYPAEPPCPMTCPDTFQPGSFSRCAASVYSSPFLVVEADEAIGQKPTTPAERAENIRRNLCVLHWLKEELDWSLRAIIHTGGKSCHGWFDRPPEQHIRELKDIAPALGIDASVFSPAHPVRLPGVRHEKTGAPSRLLYLNA
jgi:hypothetical protein